jgi:hypothetical protein
MSHTVKVLSRFAVAANRPSGLIATTDSGEVWVVTDSDAGFPVEISVA